MPYIQLTGSAYQARSILASAQRCLNLFVEPTPQTADEPIGYTHYPTPGTTLLAQNPNAIFRAVYRATNLNLYVCVGQQVFYVDSNFNWTLIGTIHGSLPSDSTPRTTPVSMCDNGSILLMADGSNDGWYIDLTQPIASQTLNRIDTSINTGWLGADWISYQDTFFLANQPGTPNFYISVSDPTADTFIAAYQVEAATAVNAGTGYIVGDILTLTGTGSAQITVYGVSTSGQITQQEVTFGGVVGTQPSNPVATTGGTGTGATFNLIYGQGSGAFNPLDFSAKSGMTDNLVAAISIHRILILIGTSSVEYWQNSGGDGTTAGSFPFSIMYGAFQNMGCGAKYSIAWIANLIFWLQQDAFGHGMILQGSGLEPKRISTHAIEYEISTYPTISDAVGYCYQQQGHIFYVLNFPSANKTWVYDSTVNEWHERCWIDDNGTEYRHRVNNAAEAYGYVVGGDWENSNLYAFDLNNFTDNGQPIKRLRSFPHQIDTDGNRRISYNQLIANMQVGAAQIGTSQTIIDCSFTDTNGTLLQDYSNINDIGSTFTKDTSGINLEIYNDAASAPESGSASYTASGTPTQDDYSVSFNVAPASYTADPPPAGATIYVIGRANASGNGYQAGMSSDGTQFYATLAVMGGASLSLGAGTLASGFYSLTLAMQQDSISLAVQRSQDGEWLQVSGAWGGIPTACLSLTDSTYAGPGQVLVGGNWT